MGRREERLVRALIEGSRIDDAARASGLSLESARAFLASVARFAAAVGSGMDFGGPAAQHGAAADGDTGSSDMTELVIETDGASRGNPGPSGAGVVILSPEGTVLEELSEHIGTATNNIAEYEAVRLGLARAIALGARRVTVRMDSELVARQLQGRYKVKNPGLLDAYLRVEPLMRQLDDVSFIPVPRGENARADRLAGMGARGSRTGSD
jgi:ribonuclease HI